MLDNVCVVCRGNARVRIGFGLTGIYPQAVSTRCALKAVKDTQSYWAIPSPAGCLAPVELASSFSFFCPFCLCLHILHNLVQAIVDSVTHGACNVKFISFTTLDIEIFRRRYSELMVFNSMEILTQKTAKDEDRNGLCRNSNDHVAIESGRSEIRPQSTQICTHCTQWRLDTSVYATQEILPIGRQGCSGIHFVLRNFR